MTAHTFNTFVFLSSLVMEGLERGEGGEGAREWRGRERGGGGEANSIRYGEMAGGYIWPPTAKPAAG